MTQARDETSNRPGEKIFVAIFVAFAVLMLTQLGAETKFSASGNFFAQPRFWPAVGVIAMAGLGVAHLAAVWSARDGWDVREALVWLRPFEYLAWFMVYVQAVPTLGYLVSTILFTVLLAVRQGYRGVRTLGAAALLGLAIVLVFKTGLAVKIPGGTVYEYLPESLRNFMIVNF